MDKKRFFIKSSGHYGVEFEVVNVKEAQKEFEEEFPNHSGDVEGYEEEFNEWLFDSIGDGFFSSPIIEITTADIKELTEFLNELKQEGGVRDENKQPRDKVATN